MKVLITGDCDRIIPIRDADKIFTNAPDDIMSIGGGYTILSELQNADNTYTGVFKLREALAFPHDGRNIRVELTDAQVTEIALNPQTRPLLEWAYHLPNEKTPTGIVLWFEDFVNDLMSEAETEGLLLSLGAIVTRKGE